MQSLPVIVLGFVLGMLHATDADHVIAVSTIVSRQRSVGGAARIGLLWGVGHTLTVFAVGTAIIVFNLAIQARLERAMEFCVALMLMLLGTVTLSRVRRHVRETLTAALAQGLSEHANAAAPSAAQTQLHAHGEYVHAHKLGHAVAGHRHVQAPLTWLDRRLGSLSVYQALRPLSIGIVHGLAGSAAVTLLVLAQIREPLWACAYLLLFGLGTTLGMVLMTSAIAWPLMRAQRLPGLYLGIEVASGALSLGLGGWLFWNLASAPLA